MHYYQLATYRCRTSPGAGTFPMKNTRWARYLSLNAVYFGTSFMWNSLHPIIVPLLLLSYGSEETKNTRLGILTFVGLILAMVFQPLWGALSDRTRHRLGRRCPWIIAGSVASVLCLAIMGVAGRLWGLALGYLILQVVSNAILAASNGLIPDLVPEERRGHAVGIKSLLDVSGIIVAAVVAGALIRGEDILAAVPMSAIAAVLAACALLTVRAALASDPPEQGCRRRSPPAETARAAGLVRDRRGADFWRRPAEVLRGRSHYATLLLSRFWMLLPSYLVQSFGLYYLRDVVRVADPARAMSELMTCIGVSLALVVLPAGIASQRWGRKGPSLLAAIMMAACIGLLLTARDMTAIRVLAAITGLAMGIFVSVNWAWATDLAPGGAAATYLGLANLATAGSSALSRLGGPLIDLANGWKPNLGYTLVFGLASVSSVVAVFFTWRVPETRGPRAAGASAIADSQQGAATLQE